MNRLTRLVIAAVLFVFGLALLMAELEMLRLPGWTRTGIGLVFISAAPGHGWVWALRLDRPMVELSLSLVLSLSLSLLTSMAFVAAGAFDTATIISLLIGIGFGGSCVWLFGHRNSRQGWAQ